MTEQDIRKTYPRDVLLHLLSAVTLYWSVWAGLDLLFAYINIWVKDPLERFPQAADAINWPLATLIILFPVYLWTVWFINRDLARNPEKNEFRVRRWLLYLNLFLAALLVIGDMVALIYGFLNGDLTARFLWKILAVAAVGSAVFAYYYFDLRRRPEETGRLKWWRWGAALALAVVAVTGIALAGSPFRQRLAKFDAQKVADLQSIQAQVVSYWSAKDRLPAGLADLTDTISGFKAPDDPQLDKPYEYRVTGVLSFELCADFNLDSADTSKAMPVYYGPLETGDSNWEHPAGRYCFSRTIDPDLYRDNFPQPKPL